MEIKLVLEWGENNGMQILSKDSMNKISQIFISSNETFFVCAFFLLHLMQYPSVG